MKFVKTEQGRWEKLIGPKNTEFKTKTLEIDEKTNMNDLQQHIKLVIIEKTIPNSKFYWAIRLLKK